MVYIDSEFENSIESVVPKVNLEYDYTKSKEEFLITNFEVLKSERNKGIASSVLRTLIKEAKSASFQAIRIHIALTNPDEDNVEISSDPTVQLLNKYDFTIIGIGNTVEAKKTL